jgi:hypothetical protein
MTNELEHFEGKSRDLIEAVCRHFPGGTEENRKRSQSGSS